MFKQPDRHNIINSLSFVPMTKLKSIAMSFPVFTTYRINFLLVLQTKNCRSLPFAENALPILHILYELKHLITGARNGTIKT